MKKKRAWLLKTVKSKTIILDLNVIFDSVQAFSTLRGVRPLFAFLN